MLSSNHQTAKSRTECWARFFAAPVCLSVCLFCVTVFLADRPPGVVFRCPLALSISDGLSTTSTSYVSKPVFVCVGRPAQVFHTYDYRYQDGYSRQRVAAMYLPLIHHMAAKV